MLLIDYLFVGIIVLLVICCLAIESDSIRRNLRQLGVLMLTLCGAFCYLLVTAESSDSFFFSDFAGNKSQSSSSRRQSEGKGGNGKGADPVAGRDPSGPGDGWGKDQAPADVELIAGRPPEAEEDASGGSAGGGMPKRPDQNGGAGGSGEQAEQGTVTVTVQQGTAGSPGSAETVAEPVRDCPECPLMALVPAGTFLAGSPGTEKGRFLHESPRRKVVIARAFYMGRFEITVDQFAAFLAATGHRQGRGCVADHNRSAFVDYRRPGFSQTPNHPAVCVSWEDAKAYTRWISARTRLRYRLPTEAEWELAARAGSTRAFGPGDALDPKQVNFDSLAGGTMAVGSFTPNRLGIFDMAGNVWELVEDCWHAGLAALPEDGSARPLATDQPCALRTMRGGAWYNDKRYLRSASRWANPAGVGGNGIGFRVVREIEANAAKAAALPAAPVIGAPPAPAPAAGATALGSAGTAAATKAPVPRGKPASPGAMRPRPRRTRD